MKNKKEYQVNPFVKYNDNRRPTAPTGKVRCPYCQEEIGLATQIKDAVIDITIFRKLPKIE